MLLILGGHIFTRRLSTQKKLLGGEFESKFPLKELRIPFKVFTYKEFYYSNTDRRKVVTKHFIDGFTSSTFSLKKYSAVSELPTVDCMFVWKDRDQRKENQ